MTVDKLAGMLHQSYPHEDCGWPEESKHKEFIYELAEGLLPRLRNMWMSRVAPRLVEGMWR